MHRNGEKLITFTGWLCKKPYFGRKTGARKTIELSQANPWGMRRGKASHGFAIGRRFGKSAHRATARHQWTLPWHRSPFCCCQCHRFRLCRQCGSHPTQRGFGDRNRHRCQWTSVKNDEFIKKSKLNLFASPAQLLQHFVLLAFLYKKYRQQVWHWLPRNWQRPDRGFNGKFAAHIRRSWSARFFTLLLMDLTGGSTARTGIVQRSPVFNLDFTHFIRLSRSWWIPKKENCDLKI